MFYAIISWFPFLKAHRETRFEGSLKIFFRISPPSVVAFFNVLLLLESFETRRFVCIGGYARSSPCKTISSNWNFPLSNELLNKRVALGCMKTFFLCCLFFGWSKERSGLKSNGCSKSWTKNNRIQLYSNKIHTKFLQGKIISLTTPNF